MLDNHSTGTVSRIDLYHGDITGCEFAGNPMHTIFDRIGEGEYRLKESDVVTRLKVILIIFCFISFHHIYQFYRDLKLRRHSYLSFSVPGWVARVWRCDGGAREVVESFSRGSAIVGSREVGGGKSKVCGNGGGFGEERD
ncbi:hypothetical protein CsSME_00026556 [Camellia sinensis var. sinensis]